MLNYPLIDPVAISLGPLKIHWYGIMYLIAFGAAWWLGRRRARRPGSGWNDEQISDLIFYGALGVVLGGRIGYTLFYNFGHFIDDPMSILRIWEGGMSFHGGLLGVLVAMWLFGRKYKHSFFALTDFVAPLVPIGLATGRLGNFINGELWGQPTNLPWGMVFPGGGPLPRHPSQLYEMFFEGIVLFIIVWIYSAKPRPRMAVSGVFALGYGVFRFAVEFVRQPDEHLGFIAFGWLTQGQLLSAPLILTGIVLLWLAYRRQPQAMPASPEPKAKTRPKARKKKAG
ncbi:MAG TPA: prolipoprotein diacylglyceryl transferase [Gammaproteobacteria bacterium]|nr:prolipoprotein diacylglyceryl transferase [Gammaproteobacteria bacterium]